jgi:hypothetical protein
MMSTTTDRRAIFYIMAEFSSGVVGGKGSVIHHG